MADKRISDLSNASSITLADLLVLVNESQTKKTTIADLLNLIASQDQFAELDTNGKIPLEQLPETVFGAVNYQASWNAATNTPALPTAAPENKGWYYVVGTAGTTNVNGVSVWNTGDWLVSNGSVWQKIDNSSALSSWNSRTGDVVPQSGDYTTDLVTEATNKYYTAARVLAELLNGLSVQDNAITASDSILTALGKLQGQINQRELTSNKGAADGYASLESGKVPMSQLPDSVVGAVTYKGTWAANAALNPAAPANKGHYYVVNANGSFNMNGITDWKIGDWIISNGIVWQKIDNTDALTSWNGRTGAVVPQAGDYNTSQVTENAANRYYTAARVLAELLTAVIPTNSPIAVNDSISNAFNKAQGQINNRENIANKGVANGYAPLDVGSRLPKAQLTRGETAVNMNYTGWAAGVTEEVKYSYLVPAGTFSPGDMLTINAWITSTGNFGDKTMRVYLHSSTNLNTARLVATFVYTGNAAFKFERDLFFITNSTLKTLVSPANPSQKGEYTSGAEVTTTVPSISSSFYVLITLDLDDAADSSRLERVVLQGVYK